MIVDSPFHKTGTVGGTPDLLPGRSSNHKKLKHTQLAIGFG